MIISKQINNHVCIWKLQLHVAECVTEVLRRRKTQGYQTTGLRVTFDRVVRKDLPIKVTFKV